MIITRRSDYAIRILRALKDGKIHNVREICETEEIPKAFAYKIIREMEQNELVKSERGNQGGYYLNKGLDELTMYDVVSITEEDLAIVHCMKEPCSRDTDDIPCKVHQEMERLQELLNAELKSKKISDIIG
ncbi:MAG: Rrf2 family transcriptional regulator [Erysipelotrichaceae bacterium]|nr:Rrf2 family transcriptional regulator [Erysipelotrichaceae bacterium]